MQEIEVDNFYHKHQPDCEYLPTGQRARPTVDCSVVRFSFFGFLALFYSLKHLEFIIIEKRTATSEMNSICLPELKISEENSKC